jgi:hypothetical protein
MAGYIGARASVVSSGAERKQTYAITTTTTSLTGLAYTPTKVHVYHNGIRLVDGTDYTATDGSTITLTNAAQNGDEVVVISYATFQTSDTVSAANGGTFAGNVSMNGTLDVTGATTLTGQLNTGSILPSTDNASDLGSTSKRFQDLHLSGGISFDEDPSLVTGSVTGKTLDDYEEGTWTPVVSGTTTSGSASYSIQFATYTKIGRLVYWSARVGYTGHTGTGNMTITGLPFTSSNRYASAEYSYRDGLTVPASEDLKVYVPPNVSYVGFYSVALGTDAVAALSLDTNVTDLSISGVYETT